MVEQSIDTFENPFLGMEGKIKQNLGENEDAGYVIDQAVNPEKCDGEQQMFETFVKEKHTLLGYVNDLVRFAAKMQDIDLSIHPDVFGAQEEECKELRIKDKKEYCLIAYRFNLVVSILPFPSYPTLP